MAETFAYLRAVADYWGVLGTKTAVRMSGALDDIGNDAYKFERATRDVVGFYNDVIETWWNVMSGGAPVALPVISFPIKKGTNTGSVTVPLSLAAGTQVEVTDLVKVGLPASPRIPKTDVTLTVGANGDLKIDLGNLQNRAIGLYKGLVSVQQGQPLVVIELTIFP